MVGAGRRTADRFGGRRPVAVQRAHRRRQRYPWRPAASGAGETGWRLAFLAGLACAPLLYTLAAALPQVKVDTGWPALIASGLLVGIGTRYGGGCTSGHGVCGMARGSKRSLAATVAFMGAGFAVVYLLRHVFGSAS